MQVDVILSDGNDNDRHNFLGALPEMLSWEVEVSDVIVDV